LKRAQLPVGAAHAQGEGQGDALEQLDGKLFVFAGQSIETVAL